MESVPLIETVISQMGLVTDTLTWAQERAVFQVHGLGIGLFSGPIISIFFFFFFGKIR